MNLKKEMISIVYLFMNYDGKITEEEKEKFRFFVDELNKNLHSKIDLNKIIHECENIFNTAFDKEDLPLVIENNIKKIIESSYFNIQEKISLLWLLVDISYADKNCNDSEKKLLKSIFHMLNLKDKSLLYDMEDTAKAALLIETKRESAKKLDYETGKKLMEELDEEQNILAKSINELIEEGED